MPSQPRVSLLDSTPTIMPPKSFQERRIELVSRLDAMHHRLRDQHIPFSTVSEYLLEFTTDLNTLKQSVDTEIYVPDKETHTCCVHRLARIEAHLHEQALLIRDYPQGERSQKCPAIFYKTIEMITVQIGRCVVKSHQDRDAAHMELKASVVNSNLLCDSAGVGEMEVRRLKGLWRMLNAGVPVL